MHGNYCAQISTCPRDLGMCSFIIKTVGMTRCIVSAVSSGSGSRHKHTLGAPNFSKLIPIHHYSAADLESVDGCVT